MLDRRVKPEGEKDLLAALFVVHFEDRNKVGKNEIDFRFISAP